MSKQCVMIHYLDITAQGLRTTSITESPLRNIFEIKRSLFTGFA